MGVTMLDFGPAPTPITPKWQQQEVGPQYTLIRTTNPQFWVLPIILYHHYVYT